jgi:flagellar biosynthesis protein FliQ
MVAVLVALIIAYPWLLEKLTSYTVRVFQTIPTVIR